MRFFRRAYGRHVIHMLLVKKSCGSKFRSPSSIIALFPTICSHNARKFLEERNFVALIPFCTDRHRQSITRTGRFHTWIARQLRLLSPLPHLLRSLLTLQLCSSLLSIHLIRSRLIAWQLHWVTVRYPGKDHRLLFLSSWWCALPGQFCLVPRLLCLSILLDLM